MGHILALRHHSAHYGASLWAAGCVRTLRGMLGGMAVGCGAACEQ